MAIVIKPFAYAADGFTVESLVPGDERDFGVATDGLVDEGFVVDGGTVEPAIDIVAEPVEPVVEEPVIEPVVEPVAEELDAAASDEEVAEPVAASAAPADLLDNEDDVPVVPLKKRRK